MIGYKVESREPEEGETAEQVEAERAEEQARIDAGESGVVGVVMS